MPFLFSFPSRSHFIWILVLLSSIPISLLFLFPNLCGLFLGESLTPIFLLSYLLVSSKIWIPFKPISSTAFFVMTSYSSFLYLFRILIYSSIFTLLVFKSQNAYSDKIYKDVQQACDPPFGVTVFSGLK